LTEWPEVGLGEVCEFKYGKSLPAARREPGAFSVYGSNGVVGAHSEGLTSGPTIIVGRKGSFGEVNYSDSACWPIDTTYFVDATCTKADLRWLGHLLPMLRLTELNRAAAVPGLNREDAYRRRCLLPPVEEQRRIAAILDQADALRAKCREALSHLDDLTQAIFLKVFGDPVKNQRGWPITTLAQLGQLDRGVSRHRPRNDPSLLGGRHPLVQTGEVANSGGYIRGFTGTYSDVGLAQSKKWPAGTLCITIAANIAKTGILTFDACFPDSVVGFTSDRATTQYVRVWLGFLQATLERAAPQSAQKNINLAILRNLPIPKPPVESIEQFARSVEGLEEAKDLATAHAEGLDGLFASLQSRAFVGGL